jgi:hypothetical protein
MLAVVLLFLSACAWRGPGAPEGDPNLITRDQIAATHGSTVYDVIARLHAEFLRDRGATSINLGTRDVATVFLNGVEFGSIESLRTIAASDIEQIRYFPGVDAVVKFGRAYAGGVILLTSRVE